MVHDSSHKVNFYSNIFTYIINFFTALMHEAWGMRGGGEENPKPNVL